MPTVDTIKGYYDRFYVKQGKLQTEEQVTFDNPDRLGKRISNLVLKSGIDLKRFSLLDFGGGSGKIAYEMALELLKHRVESVEILIVDFEKATISSNTERIKITKKSKLDPPNMDFDLVLASGIVEHLPNPTPTLNILLSSLKPGGVFYARTPALFPFMKLIGRIGLKLDFTFPGHLHDLGQDFWETYFTKIRPNQFEILRSSPGIVETTLSGHPVQTLVSYLCKFPWYALHWLHLDKFIKYGIVGGWEIVVRKK
jgi:SAM-dependent methyltransferase